MKDENENGRPQRRHAYLR